MNSVDCTTDCSELPSIDEGKLVVIGTADADGDTAYAGCKFNLVKEFGCTYPAIALAISSTEYKIRDGSAAYPIDFGFVVSDQIRPLIMDDAGVIKRYQPNQILGKRRIVSINGSIQFVPYTFPGYISSDLEEVGLPDFYLGANRVTRMCEDDGSPLPVQLLKISYESSAVPLVANDDAIEVEFETAFNFDPILNDSGDTISVTAVSNPPNGTATIEIDGTVTYTPDAGFDGVDTFTYTITDALLATDVATVTVTVNPLSLFYKIVEFDTVFVGSRTWTFQLRETIDDSVIDTAIVVLGAGNWRLFFDGLQRPVTAEPTYMGQFHIRGTNNVSGTIVTYSSGSTQFIDAGYTDNLVVTPVFEP